MNKCFAIAVCFGFVALSVSSADAGLFGRRSSGGCSGGNCSRYNVPSVTTSLSKPSATVATEKAGETTEAPANATGGTKASVPAKSVSQPANGVESPSDLAVPQATPQVSSRVSYQYQSSCANGRCYRSRRRR